MWYKYYIKGPAVTIMAALFLSACGTTAKQLQGVDQGELVQWRQSVKQGNLQLTLHWVMPARPGPHATVVLNPGRGQEASELMPIASQLARRGYMAVALDYERRIQGSYKATLFPLREQHEANEVLQIIKANNLVDRNRIAVMGYSLGGAHAFLMASSSRDIRAVVAYYPMTDFPAWRDKKEESWIWRMVFRFVRWDYNAEAEHHNDDTHNALLQRYSAINHVNRISSPVLIIHGDKDAIAPLEHSRRLYNMIENSGRTSANLMVIEGEDHAFNFSPSAATDESWQATVSWLDRHLDDTGNVVAMNDVE